MNTIHAVSANIEVNKDWQIGLCNFPANEKLLRLLSDLRVGSVDLTSVPFTVPVGTILQLQGIQLAVIAGTARTQATFLVVDATKLVPNMRLDCFDEVHLQVFIEDMLSLEGGVDPTPDLLVSMQHGTPVAIRGYATPDTTVYKTWRPVRYVD